MNADSHAARDHATWSASSTARNVHCAGALTLAQFASEGKESIHAARGTACHEISERSLREEKDPSAYLDVVVKTKQYEITIDEELVNSATEYVDYVRNGFKTAMMLLIEQKFSLADLEPPFDAGGTGDALLYFDREKRLEVVDLKNGMGLVEVEDNWQLKTYALGAMLASANLDVERITVTIVQPRAPHKNGRIRSDTFTTGELIEWTVDLMGKMHRARLAMDQHAAAAGNTVLLDAWAEEFLRPGNCHFCPAEGFCPALRKKSLDIAKVWFDDMDQPRIGNTPDQMSPDELARTLDMLDMMENWANAVRAYAFTMADQGTTIPGYQLVEKIGNRKWAIDDEAKLASDLRSVAGLTEDQIYTKKIVSVAQAEKIGGVRVKKLIANMWEKPITGKSLVSAEKTTRPAVGSKAAQYFEKQD